MSIIVFKPDKEPTKIAGELSFDDICNLVGGYVEFLHYGKYIFACDEDGRMRGKRPCICVESPTGRHIVLTGNVVLCKEDAIDSGDVVYRGLSSGEIREISDKIYLFGGFNYV